MTASIVNTIATDISQYLTGVPVEIITEAEAIFSDLKSGAELEAIIIDAVPPSAESVVYHAGTYASSLLEEILTASTPTLETLLTSVKALIDGKLPNKAGSDLLRLIPAIVALAEAYYKAPGGPAVEQVASASSKAVTIKAVIANAPPPSALYSLTAAEWASVLAARQQAATNAAADAPLDPNA
jgi:hypothetical protein